MTNIYITSDHHFTHKNILKYQPDTRPFNNVDEMDDAMVERHNSMVNPEDEVYFLGDFAMTRNVEYIKAVLRQMNGKKYMVLGNHDKVMKDPAIAEEFEWQKDYYELRISNRGKKQPNIVMSHYPLYSWNRMHHGALHMYGHTHNAIPTMHGGRGRDIGMDSNNCYPHDIRTLIDEMSQCEMIDARDR